MYLDTSYEIPFKEGKNSIRVFLAKSRDKVWIVRNISFEKMSQFIKGEIGSKRRL